MWVQAWRGRPYMGRSGAGGGRAAFSGLRRRRRWLQPERGCFLHRGTSGWRWGHCRSDSAVDKVSSPIGFIFIHKCVFFSSALTLWSTNISAGVFLEAYFEGVKELLCSLGDPLFLKVLAAQHWLKEEGKKGEYFCFWAFCQSRTEDQKKPAICMTLLKLIRVFLGWIAEDVWADENLREEGSWLTLLLHMRRMDKHGVLRREVQMSQLRQVPVLMETDSFSVVVWTRERCRPALTCSSSEWPSWLWFVSWRGVSSVRVLSGLIHESLTLLSELRLLRSLWTVVGKNRIKLSHWTIQSEVFNWLFSPSWRISSTSPRGLE